MILSFVERIYMLLPFAYAFHFQCLSEIINKQEVNTLPKVFFIIYLLFCCSLWCCGTSFQTLYSLFIAHTFVTYIHKKVFAHAWTYFYNFRCYINFSVSPFIKPFLQRKNTVVMFILKKSKSKSASIVISNIENRLRLIFSIVTRYERTGLENYFKHFIKNMEIRRNMEG